MSAYKINYWVTILFIFIATSVYSQKAGHFFIKNYTYEDHSFHEQTWATVESDYGKIFFGHNLGIIEYDGNNWNLIETPAKSVVRCFKKVDNGLIYVGGTNELGYLERDENKIVRYHSLTYLIDSANRTFNDIWKIAINDNRIYFRCDKGVVIYNPKERTAIFHNTEKFGRFIQLSDKWFYHDFEKGLAPLEGDSLIYDEKYSAFKKMFLYVNTNYSKSMTLICDYKKGFLIYNSVNNSFSPWKNSINKEISNNIHNGLTLNFEHFLFITNDYGAIIVNKKGDVISEVNKTQGLRENSILNAYTDNHNNIWFNLNNGMAHVEYAQPFSILDEKYGIEGFPYFSFVDNDMLYTATTNGLYNIDLSEDKFNYKSKYKNTELSNAPFFSHIKSGDTILISSSLNIYSKEDDKFKKIYNKMAWSFSKFDNHFIATTHEGIIKLFRDKNKWKIEPIKGVNKTFKFCLVESPNTIWACQEVEGIFKLTLNNEHDSIVKIDIINKGLPTKVNNRIYKYNDSFIVASGNGIYKFNNDTKSFKPVNEINKYIGKGGVKYFNQTNAKKKGFWFWSENNRLYHGGMVKFEFGGTNFDTISFQKLQRYQVYDIDEYGDNVFFTTEDGVIVYDIAKHNTKGVFNSFISEITNYAGDSILFGTFINWDRQPQIFSYKDNDITFHFGANFYQNNIDLKYSYFLEGLHNKWSKWSTSPQIKFNSLPYGEYTFRLKAKNIYGEISEESTFPFKIKAPWYLTGYAFFAMILLLVLTIIIFIRIKEKQLKHKNIVLEKIVDERTRELQIQRNQLEKEKIKTEELNITKDKFFSIIAHDLKNPFNSLLGLTEILYEDYNELDDEERLDIINNLRKSSNHTYDLLENLLTWSRTQRKEVIREPNTYNIYNLVDETINLLKNNIIQKSITVHNDVSTDTVGFFDKNMIITVIRNLISNAIKFTDKKGVIEISDRIDNGKIIITVKDNGVGINAENLKNIFVADKQTKSKGTANESGTGLGLLICKDFVEQNGGKLTVKSELTKGSEFIFSLKQQK
ncbi:MAG: ATP-binding protein [Bacteroidota bacterium]|nr:ATP-binding protein [Bacteroidota bacterium]